MRLKNTYTIIAATLMITIIIAAYVAWPKAGTRRLIVSTTTSLYDTGVIDMIEDAFEEEQKIDLHFISVGTGLAIAHAERGDADMILVHAPGKEQEFMEEGYGVNRKIIAYNYFTIVGPPDDPAGIRGMDPIGAMETLVEMGRKDEATWVSRGDDSGTHSKEMELWLLIGLVASELGEEPWYFEAGTGMGKTLQIAEEKQGYTLADMGTYLKYGESGLVSLEVMVESGPSLINVYSAIAVNPDTVQNTEFEGATTFIEFLASEEGQALIGEYGIESYGMSLFKPAVKLLETESDPEVTRWIEEAAFFMGSECPPEYRRGDTDLYG
ncbi:substrate-binding domain-containing protein [Candidatus Bathyarchaeota archaeon]|nr:substrate-binding domain-containing protein [Candidatus Bathyarchaeota archaeon]